MRVKTWGNSGPWAPPYGWDWGFHRIISPGRKFIWLSLHWPTGFRTLDIDWSDRDPSNPSFSGPEEEK